MPVCELFEHDNIVRCTKYFSLAKKINATHNTIENVNHICNVLLVLTRYQIQEGLELNPPPHESEWTYTYAFACPLTAAAAADADEEVEEDKLGREYHEPPDCPDVDPLHLIH